MGNRTGGVQAHCVHSEETVERWMLAVSWLSFYFLSHSAYKMLLPTLRELFPLQSNISRHTPTESPRWF